MDAWYTEKLGPMKDWSPPLDRENRDHLIGSLQENDDMPPPKRIEQLASVAYTVVKLIVADEDLSARQVINVLRRISAYVTKVADEFEMDLRSS